jgi:hypothetical protein
MTLTEKAKKLLNGQIIISIEPGNSMTPILRSRQPVRLEPITYKDVSKGDIVYCRVRGNFYTHKVIAICENRGVLIGNNHGRINGWTKAVFGKVTEILPM